MSEILTGRRYNDEQRDAVFSVWAFQADRSGEKTARLVADDLACQELGVTDVASKTVLNWLSAYNWPERADRLLHANAGRLRFETQISLILAAPEAARFTRMMVNLDDSLATDRTLIDKDGVVHTFREFNDKILKLRTQNAIAVLDRTGFSPIGTRDQLGVIDSPPSALDQAAKITETMNQDELREHEAQVRKQLAIGRG